MRLLCLSDIHGNLDALQAVLATAERRSFNKLLVAGDVVFPGLTDASRAKPLETWRRLTAAGAIIVQGTTDRALAMLDPASMPAKTDHEKRMVERMRAVRAELGDLVLERLRRLPAVERIPLEDGGELVLVHGSPSDPTEGMSHDLDDDELLALVADDPGDVFVCGRTHVAFERVVGDMRIVNVGSVGEAPDGVEPGAPPKVAHATWIETSPAGVVVEQITVPLD
jgi:predicted phosphodiesterase